MRARCAARLSDSAGRGHFCVSNHSSFSAGSRTIGTPAPNIASGTKSPALGTGLTANSTFTSGTYHLCNPKSTLLLAAFAHFLSGPDCGGAVLLNYPLYERIRQLERPSVKDLDLLSKAVAVLLALATMLGCQGLDASKLTVSPSSMSFGNVPIGQSQSQPATLSNSGGSSLTLNQVTVSGTGFSISGLSLPLTLVPGQSVMMMVTFTPSSSGSTSGTVSLLGSISMLALDGQKPKGQSSISTLRSVSTSLSLPVSGAGITTGQLAAAPSSLSFGSVQVGATQTASVALANTSNTTVTISQATITGAGFSLSGLSLPLTLSAGQSTNFKVTFAPQTGGSANGSVSVVSNAANSSLTLALSGNGGTPGTLAATSISLSFGSVQIGSSTTRSETLTNSGGSSVKVTQASVTGSGFSVTGLSLPMALSPGQSFTFGVAFAPTSAGSASGSISVVSDASNPNLTIALAGSGTSAGQLSVSPGSLSFGSVVVGTSKSLSASLSASGASVTVSSATFGTSEFTLSGISFPLTLAAGQSASFAITFRPQASGSASDSASFSSNASNSPTMETLSGSGAVPPPHSVSLSWDASTSSVVGYNVYRGSATGGPYAKINSGLNASTNYTDNSVQAGLTYYYVTTAVDGSGLESGYSNQVQAVIPTP